MRFTMELDFSPRFLGQAPESMGVKVIEKARTDIFMGLAACSGAHW